MPTPLLSSQLPTLAPSSASASKYPFPSGPSHPSTSSRATHSRRPSRAERYEALVDAAREVLKRGNGGAGRVGLGIAQGGQGHRGEDDRVDESEWRDSVSNLLKVVDGMAQQLSTHDELAAQLKIAQSNLTLAETHSEFLEETLRRRDSRSSASSLAMAGRMHSIGGGGTGTRPRASTDEGAAAVGGEVDAEGNAGGHGGGGARNFFRLPSKRKPTPSTTSIASTSTTSSMPPPPNPPYAHTLRSVSSSPRLRDPSPVPHSPSIEPRFSTSTTSSASTDPPLPLSSELFALHAQITSLETECSALRSSKESLKRNNDMLVAKCAELEKTKEDLMSELENLSVELFSEANSLVAEERRSRAAAEDQVAHLRAEVASLSSQLSSLRTSLASRPLPPALDPTSPELPALSPSEPTTPLLPLSAEAGLTASPPSISTTASPSPNPSIDRPPSVASSVASASTAGRKWFSFGRSNSSSSSYDPTAEPAPPPPKMPARSNSQPPSTLHLPHLARGESGSPLLSSPSSVGGSSFFSFAGGVGGSPNLVVSEEPEEEESQARGEEKAKTLELGIRVREKGERTASEGGRTPVAIVSDEAKRRHYPPEAEREKAPSPPLPALPPAPTSPPALITDPSLLPFASASSSSPVPGPTARPPRLNTTHQPRPLAIHSPSPNLSSVGGPTAAEMTAAARSPKSPNEMRWKEVAGSLGGAGAGGRPSGSERRNRSNSRSRNDGGKEKGGEWDKLPPSPVLPASRTASPRISGPSLSSSSSTRANAGLRIETSGAPHPPAATPAVLPPVLPLSARPSSAAPSVEGASRPPLRQTQSANSHGPAASSASPHPAAALLRADSASRPRSPMTLITPSTSLSSIASSSLSAHSQSSSSTRGKLVGGGGGGGGGGGKPLSPATGTEGTKAVEDLESLMQSIVEMNEGLFGGNNEDDDEEEELGERRAREIEVALEA
ncbi:hypothetical protein JCM1840_004325 [Sporobolomyces johnsonii]